MADQTRESQDFPRGGAPILTPLEARKIRKTAERDALFKDSTGVALFKKKKKILNQKSGFHQQSTKKDSKSGVDHFTFKYLVKNMLILGYVKELSKNEVVIGLPNGLNGYIPRTEVQSFLTSFNEEEDIDEEVDDEELTDDSMFAIGQLLPVKVVELNSSNYGFKKIVLSTLPENINEQLKINAINKNMMLWGYVRSIEDHGVIVSFGSKQNSRKGLVGFLPRTDEHENIKVGMMKWFVVKSKNKETQALKLSTEKDKIKTSMVDHAKRDVKFNSIMPGQLVEMAVDDWNEDGVIGKVFGSFNCVVEALHLPDDKLKKQQKTVKGRILHVNPSTKQIGVSLLNTVIEFPDNINKTEYSTGSFIDECRVTKLNQYEGVYMELPNHTQGFVHISRFSEDTIDKVPKQYHIGSKHKCRVLGYSGLDACYTLTLKQSDFDVTFLRYEDVAPGAIVSGEIAAFESFGLIVKLTKHIKGICPLVHLSDITFTEIKRPAKKFVVGKKIKCRVLNVKASTKQLTLTHKKTLVKSELPILSNYENAKIGGKYHGFVTQIKDFGLIVSFYNNIKAILPKNDLGGTRFDSYYIGKVICVIVKSVKPNQRKMTVTLKEDISNETSEGAFKLGEIHSAKAIDVNAGNVVLDLGGNSILPLSHITDYVELNRSWEAVLSSLPDNFSFNGLYCLGYNAKTKKVIFSRKSIVKNFGATVKTFQDLKPHMLLPGIITNVLPYGVFVEVAPGVTGLSPNNYIADTVCRDPSKLFEIGQSVIVKVLEQMDKEKERFTVTLKPSLMLKHKENPVNTDYCEEQNVGLYLKERENLFLAAALSQDKVISILPTLVDQVIIVKAVSHGKEGINVEYDDNGTILCGCIQTGLEKGMDITAGDEIQCHVINLDLKKRLFYCHLDEEVIEGVIKRTKKKKKKEQEIPEKSSGNIVYTDNDISIAVLPDYKYHLAYVNPRKHLNHMLLKPRYMLGEKIHMAIIKGTSNGLIAKQIEETVAIGSVVSGFIKSVKPNQLTIDLQASRIHGRVHVTQVVDVVQEGKSPLEAFKVKQAIIARVIAFRDMKTNNYLPITHTHSGKYYAELSMKPSVMKADSVESEGKFLSKDFKEFTVGEEVNCFTTSACNKCIYVAVNAVVKAKIPLLNISQDLKEVKQLTHDVKPGYAFSTAIVDIDKDRSALVLSRIGDPLEVVKRGKIVIGRVVKKLNHVGLFIQLPNMKAGIAHLTELNDTYVENPLDEFELEQFVRCFIVDVSKDKIDLSLRTSRLSHCKPEEGHDRSISSYDDIKEGDIIRGYVKSGTKVGVFVSIGPGIDARVQIKNLSQYFVKDYQSFFPVGKLVKGKVRRIDPSTNHIDFSLRGTDVGGPDPVPPPERSLPVNRKRSNSQDSNTSEDKGSPAKKNKFDEDSDVEANESETEESEMEVSDEEQQTTEVTSSEKPVLKLSKKFDWNSEDVKINTPVSSTDSDNEGDNDGENAKALAKKTRRQKRAAKKEEEESLRKAELLLLDNDRPLESAEDFDRMVLRSPNSSIVWIQYMAFHLHSSEVERARAIGQKAIKTISFREEQEKFNVWVALLNLQATYGSKTELEETFRNALKMNEPKKVYMKMADIYVKDPKYMEETESLYKEMLKKFKTSKKVWISYGWFLMKNGKKEEARNLLARSVKSLPEKKYIEATVKFAVFEYKCGESQRGSTVFETLLKHYPKRSDIWSVYIDMVIKQEAYEQVRNIFERVTALNLSIKKMKFFFKRYIAFEEQYGTSATVKKVRGKAMEYVESRFVEE